MPKLNKLSFCYKKLCANVFFNQIWSCIPQFALCSIVRIVRRNVVEIFAINEYPITTNTSTTTFMSIGCLCSQFSYQINLELTECFFFCIESPSWYNLDESLCLQLRFDMHAYFVVFMYIYVCMLR